MARWPDFFIAGAPKAGTTALHAALVGVPGIALSTVEGTEVLPLRRARRPGPATGAGRRAQPAGVGVAAGRLPRTCGGTPRPARCVARARRSTSTTPQAQERIAAVAPDGPVRRHAARPRRPRVLELDAPVVRRPGAGSGLPPRGRGRGARGAAGWAPFWRYRGLGRYGEQLERLLPAVPP